MGKKHGFEIFKDILRCFYNGEEYCARLSGEELREVFGYAKEQDMAGIAFYVLSGGDCFNGEPELYAKAKREYRFTLYSAEKQREAAQEIRQAFGDRDIPIILFKGAHIRECYPVPELRTMGDMDCLTDMKDKATAKEIMLGLGYEFKDINEDVEHYKRGLVTIEMHGKLSHASTANKFDYSQYFGDAFSEASKRADGYYYFNDEYLLCYLFSHIAKHLSSTGAGIRMVFDVAVFTRQIIATADMELVKNRLEQAKLTGTASAVYGIIDRWLGTEFVRELGFDGRIPDGLEEYIICGGTFGFGTHDVGDIYRRRAYSQGDNGNVAANRIRALCYFFFPTGKNIVNQYLPAAEKHKWLMPIMWAKRFFTALFKRGRHSVETLESIATGDAGKTQREAKMLDELGL